MTRQQTEARNHFP